VPVTSELEDTLAGVPVVRRPTPVLPPEGAKPQPEDGADEGQRWPIIVAVVVIIAAAVAGVAAWALGLF
jgi:hypothetical protein